MEYGAYNFKIGNSGNYDNNEVCVKAANYREAVELANSLIKGSKLKLGELRRVIDCRLSVNESTILERKMIVEERQLDVTHSGRITEIKVDGGKLGSDDLV